MLLLGYAFRRDPKTDTSYGAVRGFMVGGMCAVVGVIWLIAALTR